MSIHYSPEDVAQGRIVALNLRGILGAEIHRLVSEGRTEAHATRIAAVGLLAALRSSVDAVQKLQAGDVEPMLRPPIPDTLPDFEGLE